MFKRTNKTLKRIIKMRFDFAGIH